MSNDGGPAFPETPLSGGHLGMSLRDYFAAHAHIHIYDDPNEVYYSGATGVEVPTTNDPVSWAQFWADVEAKLRYMRADAMLKAREQ